MSLLRRRIFARSCDNHFWRVYHRVPKSFARQDPDSTLLNLEGRLENALRAASGLIEARLGGTEPHINLCDPAFQPSRQIFQVLRYGVDFRK